MRVGLEIDPAESHKLKQVGAIPTPAIKDNMISLLFSLLIALIVVGIIYWIATLLPIPEPFKKIALALCLLILLIWVLNIVGIGSSWRFR